MLFWSPGVFDHDRKTKIAIFDHETLQVTQQLRLKYLGMRFIFWTPNFLEGLVIPVLQHSTAFYVLKANNN